jgi:DNA-binding IclR family transcriptional regulator
MSPNTLAPYVLQVIACHQRHNRLCTLQDVVDELQVRRADVRRTVSALHREGFVDALRMRLTLRGFALGTALLRVPLPPLRACAPVPCGSCVAAA